MANTIDGLVPVIMEAFDTVNREPIGFLDAIALAPGVDGVGIGQSVTWFRTEAATLSDNTPANVPPNDGGQTLTPVSMTLTKSKHAKVVWTGEEQLLIRGQINNVLRDQLVQALRTLSNAMEADVALEARNGASLFVGTAGTTPFATANDLSDTAAAARALDENGAPQNDRKMVIGFPEMQNLRSKNPLLLKVNESGDSTLLRSGLTTMPITGFDIHYSGQIQKSVAAGTGSGYLVNNTGGYAVGARALTVDTGTGTILKGDRLTIGGLSYVVDTALAANVVTLAFPGLRAAVADNAPITLSATGGSNNVFFHKQAIVLATRPPAAPQGGDMATDRMNITDPVSGVTFEFSLWPGYRQNRIEIAAVWGQKAVKPENIGILLG